MYPPLLENPQGMALSTLGDNLPTPNVGILVTPSPPSYVSSNRPPKSGGLEATHLDFDPPLIHGQDPQQGMDHEWQKLVQQASFDLQELDNPLSLGDKKGHPAMDGPPLVHP